MKRALVLSALLLSACVSGPKPEKATRIGDTLDYRNYESRGTVMSVPVLKRAERETRLRGRLRLDDPMQVLPPLAKVRLLQAGKLVLETTASQGAFELRGHIPNGDYRLEAAARCLAGSGNLHVQSYEQNGIELPLGRTRCE